MNFITVRQIVSAFQWLKW